MAFSASCAQKHVASQLWLSKPLCGVFSLKHDVYSSWLLLVLWVFTGCCCVQIQAMLDTYASKYHDLKAPRKLKWKPALGSVSLTIRVGGDNLDLNVTPLHATIIMHFQVNPFCFASSSCC